MVVWLKRLSPPDEVSGGIRNLDAVFSQCREDPDCAATYPDVEAHFGRLLAEIEGAPLVLDVHPSLGLPDSRVVLSRQLLVRYIQRGLLSGRLAPTLPLLISRTAEGHPEALLAFLPDVLRGPRASELAEGLALATLCYDESATTPTFLQRIRDEHPLLHTGGWYDARIDALCPGLHDRRASEEERNPADTGIPTLVLGGELDSTVPPSLIRYAAEVESGATLIFVPTEGHGVAGFRECSDRRIAAFLEDPSTAASRSCPEQEATIPFVTGVRPVAGLGRFASVAYLRPESVEGTGAGDLANAGGIASALLLLLSLVGWIAKGLWRRVRPAADPETQSGAQSMATALAASMCAVGILFAVALQPALVAAGSLGLEVLFVGVPSRYGWVFLLPWLFTALSAAVAVTAWIAWRRGWWGTAGRVHYTIAALGSLGLASFMWYWPLV